MELILSKEPKSPISKETLQHIWGVEKIQKKEKQSWPEFLVEKGLPADADFNDCFQVLQIIIANNLLDPRRPRLRELIERCKRLAGIDGDLLKQVAIFDEITKETAAEFSADYVKNRKQLSKPKPRGRRRSKKREEIAEPIAEEAVEISYNEN